MELERSLAGKGLWYLFLSEILALVGIVAIIVPVLGWIAAPIMMLAGGVLQCVGPYVARTAHPNFQTAFYVAIAGIVVGLISAFLPEEGFLAAVVEVITAVLRFAETYLICTASEALLAEVDGVLANRASLIWKLYGGCAVVEILAIIVGGVPVLNILVGIASVVSAVVSVVALVLLILFYYQSSKALRGA